MSEAPAPYLVFDDIVKEYPGVKALRGVTFGVREGSVHALMGENGAGKSTLLKTLSGAHRPTSGCLRIGGRERVFASTSEALSAGVAVIYQELHLVPEMSVAENIFIGHWPARGGVINRAALREAARKQLDRLGEQIDPDEKLGRLSIAQRQMVEIAKALSHGAKIIAFDEPTSSLSAQEIRRLFGVIADLRRSGCAILYVTHRMEEVFQICDACTVLRDGQHVHTHERMSEVDSARLVRDMVGRSIENVFDYRVRALGDTALELREITGPGVVSPVSLSVARGEILGLFGLIGAGRTELLKIIFGALAKNTGEILLDGTLISLDEPGKAIAAGVVYSTEDRKRDGIIPGASVLENCNLTARQSHCRRGGLIDEKWERSNVDKQIAAMRVKTPSPFQAIKNLSGGNQQKVILGRWLSQPLKVLMLDEPTRGIDVGARSEIYQLMFSLAERGLAVIFVSSDLPEVLGLADRVVVMRQGQLSAIFNRADATPERVLEAALPIESTSTP
ncbi:MAG TPA: L-arabinose ABC transporter ATP-binding protein AraG [Opitutaceae bacterium]